ncbi:neuronal acetylcholine receptor subunit beta-3-like [Glandiceps talaboti]
MDKNIRLGLKPLIVVLTVTAICVVHGDDEAALLDELLSDYNKLTRPVDKRNDSVEVVVDLVIVKIVNVDIKHSTIKADVIFKQIWNDKRLSWNSSDHNHVNYLYVPPDKIWFPNIILSNTFDGQISPSIPPLVKLHSSGTVICTSIGSLQSHCYLELKYFPFDRQTCSFRFVPHLYNSKEVTLSLVDRFDIEGGILFINFEWEILNTSAHVASTFFITLDLQHTATFIIEMERKYHYYLMMIVVPSTVISFLSLCSFCLPPECGERLSLGFSLLVALSVYQLLVGDMLPSNSKVPAALGMFILYNMLVVSSTIVWSILMINLKKYATMGYIPPSCIRKVLSNKCCHPGQRKRRELNMGTDINLPSPSQSYVNEVEVWGDETMDTNIMTSRNPQREEVKVPQVLQQITTRRTSMENSNEQRRNDTCHEQRKVTRQAITAINLKTKPNDNLEDLNEAQTTIPSSSHSP